MRNIPSHLYLQTSLVLAALKWFDGAAITGRAGGNATGRNCLAAIRATMRAHQ